MYTSQVKDSWALSKAARGSSQSPAASKVLGLMLAALLSSACADDTQLAANDEVDAGPAAVSIDKAASPALSSFVGSYEHRPIQNDWHKVEIKLENGRLWWSNAAKARWSLTYQGGVLRAGSDCPYGAQNLTVQPRADGSIVSLGFQGGTYTRLGGGGTGGGSCTDSNQLCSGWAERGECTKNPGYMLKSCCASCDRVSGGGTNGGGNSGGGTSGGGTSGGTSCAQGCAAPTPICGADLKCTNKRRVEPISTLPAKWKDKLDTRVWTKWVRSVIPVVGQAATQDAALLEVAYYAERIHMPRGQILVPDLVNSMLGARPTRFSVYPACPNAWMHPAVKPVQSSGGGGADNTLVTEDWVLRYPKCTGANAVACNLMKPGTLCNNCGWAGSEPDTCRDTLAHEHGHTIEGHRRLYIDPSIDAANRQVFSYNTQEGPAWSASQYFMNPSLESGAGRDRGRAKNAQERNYWSTTMKFDMSKYPAGWGYVLKTTRCPQMGLTQPCPDTLTRTYSVPMDSYR